INTLAPIASVTTNLDTLTTARSFAQSTLDIANKKIVFTSNPGLAEGQAVVYTKGNGSASIGLVDGQVYYVKLDSADLNAVQLTSSLGGSAILLVSAGSGTGVDTLTPAAVFDPSSLHVL